MAMIVRVLMAGCAVAGCNPGPEAPRRDSASPAAAEPAKTAAGWALQRDAASASLTLGAASGQPVIRLICRSGAKLRVNVPAFRPVASEERLSFGGGAESMVLVATSAGDRELGGVSGEGRTPDELKRLIVAPISASYGAQTSGPHAAPPERLAGPFLSACADQLTKARTAESKPQAGTNPCLAQDGTLLRMPAMRAVGTEPFWNARTQGRCVTYSTPEDQKGTRIWTRVETGPQGPVWVGAFRGKPFALRVQPALGCSDGMSDKRYDWDATLSVGGEERRGCAERK